MRYLYYCDTPIQFLNTLNLCFNHVLDNDDKYAEISIFIVNQFSTAEMIYKNILKERIFDRVYLINREDRVSQKNGLTKYIGIGEDVMFPERLLRQQFGDIDIRFLYNGFDVIVASFFTHTVAAIRTLNRNATFYMMDDGAGSYAGNIISASRSRGYLKLLTLRNGGKNVYTPEALYVNCVEACHSEITNNILPLPKFNEEFLSLAFRLFDIPAQIPEYKQSVIWLSQASANPIFKAGNEHIAAILSSYKDDTIVRLHPRETNVDQYNAFTKDQAGVMWELQLTQIDLDNKLLVSCHSTALLTPKLLLGKEPYLLFAYKLFRLEDPSFARGFDSIIDQLNRSYKNPEKILVPNTWEEFEESINVFLKGAI